MSAQQVIETTVAGLGYDLVDIEWAARGLLRVTIDHPPAQGEALEKQPAGGGAPEAQAAAAPRAITVEDCERVTRQLQLSLEVDGVEYQRLEVSSPGLDRPLRREQDYARFAGCEVQVTLKQAFKGRKNWRGMLQPRLSGWSLELTEGEGGKALNGQALEFGLDEVRDARLVPVLDFRRGTKNKGKKDRRSRPARAGAAGDHGGQKQ